MREDLNENVIDWGRALVNCLATWRVEDALRARTATVRSMLMGGDEMVDLREVKRDVADGVHVDVKLRFLRSFLELCQDYALVQSGCTRLQ
jgi:hypothetical protein